MDATAKMNPASLDKHLKTWIRTLGRKWHTPEPQTVKFLTSMWGEIANRTKQYPMLGNALREDRLDLRQISKIAMDCYVLKGRFDAIRVGQFFNDERATSVIGKLVRSFPRSNSEAAQRIDDFVQRTVELGFKDPAGSEDASGAALFASVLLTAIEPKRFVDFRRGRWAEMATRLRYDLPKKDSYGQELLQAGRFAQAVCHTPTFQRFWPDQEPMWVLSGICWMRSSPPKPKELPPEIEEEIDLDATFPEGRRLEKIHRGHERNRKVIKLAKELALQRDHLLPCDVCGFSFITQFGELGEAFIEAHHTKPVASLKRGHRTKVEDIALVCPNCHRMLHRGESTVEVTELRRIVEKRRK